MKKATLTDLQARFADYLALSRKEPVMVMRNGKPVAILIGVHDEQEAERLVFASSRRFRKFLKPAARKSARDMAFPMRNFGSSLRPNYPCGPRKL